MPISEGDHYIRNKGFGAYVQRALNEDTSLNPKSVIAVPPGVEANLWYITKEGDFYVLKDKGAPAFAKDNLVFVSVAEEYKVDVKWRLTEIPNEGRNVYLIESVNKHGGWVLPTEEPYTQVAFRPLIVGPREPPFYPPNQLWVITPLVD
ncbi:uncharacterized protein LACBIDRAFT_295829 [Laccaria bicolor S238N-H82]|uniref:Predicted protein n=1 Tax=Laccaria bicolor (strain S238N-H82 / ATCC MYA-4686) TaxID=486041 RepID=B0DZ10_LACBS|nr:uncharacterized protein LACBIDRAFT_295829 [Laccaria bicolor S238N-H82]EDR00113.1 predicted protein [Laccaria bicolor S238N-H82]|eukprot:XP_001889170.1 predicted protein [Laccaria bicolor S238N-H82]